VSTQVPVIAAFPSRLGLNARLGIVAAILVLETLAASYLIQATPLDLLTGPAASLRHIQHWLFRFLIAYAVSLAMLVSFRGTALAAISASGINSPVRIRWWILHALLLVPFAFFSATLYAGTSALPFAALAIGWHVCALAALLALFAAMAPLPVWANAVRQTGSLPLYAILPAAAAVAAIQGSQLLWGPAAEVTFRFVQILLQPLAPTLHSDPSTLIVATDHFAVQIAEVCSGLEGMGLMLAFCTAWLWCFRREYYFPQALLVVPVGVALVFVLNAVRIAALVLIGDAGYERMAVVGFHSQAGWIGFNIAAFGVAILARRNPWVSRIARQRRVNAAALSAAAPVAAAPTAAAPAAADPFTANPTAAYLMPLLVILAAGMIARALSAGFELLYPLRFVGALTVLWYYRRSYSGLDLRCTWRAAAAGAALFVVWTALASWLTTPTAEPSALSSLSAPLRAGWIGCRVLAAILTVPMAEELAYRGYLMRRLVSPRFETVAFSDVRWLALVVSAVAFGAMHGGMWLPGILAGLVYGALAMKTGKLGEAIVAHGITNALLAGYVLLFDQWQLW
jgi:exosortase E/protease (VPEID-CTERM system)